MTLVPALLAGRGARIYCSREYPLNELNRDRAVAQTLDPLGVEITGFDDSVLVPPSNLNTGKGKPYTVFSAYKKRWDVWLDSSAGAAVASR